MPPMGKMNTAKAKNFKKTMKRLLSDLKPLYPKLILIAVIVIISAAFKIISPLVLKNVLETKIASFINTPSPSDLDVVGRTFKLTANIPLILETFSSIIGLYVLSAILSWIADWIIIKMSADYAYQMRNNIKAKLDRLPLNYYDKNTYGEILSRGTSDITTIADSMQQIINQLMSGIALIIGVTIAMFITSWRLALVTLATVPLSMFVTFAVVLRSQKQFRTYFGKQGRLNAHIEENYGGFKIIKLFNKEEAVIDQFCDINEDMANANRKSQFLSGLIFPSLIFVSNLVYVGICLVGGIYESVAVLITFITFLNLFQQPFQQIGQISNVIQSTVAAAERVHEVFDEQDEIPDSANCVDEANIAGDISFNHVDFSYNKNVSLIEDMNVQVARGDNIAIVGPTGAGKTTIVNLIMRFYEIDKGEIILDNYNLTQYKRADVRKSIGMVLQDAWLFSGTIMDNIRYGRLEATDEEVYEAARAAHADFFIKTLPHGYDTVLNEDGTNISQGQRQLLTIARAIISQPKILILDEATSSVDTRTELAIQDAMTKMMEGRTSFVIAHRLSTIKKAKLILVMRKGKIIETGTHEELLKQKGFYSDLYNAQFLGTNPLAQKEQ